MELAEFEIAEELSIPAEAGPSIRIALKLPLVGRCIYAVLWRRGISVFELRYIVSYGRLVVGIGMLTID